MGRVHGESKNEIFKMQFVLLFLGFAAAQFAPSPDRQPLPNNCPSDVDPEFCYTVCNSMICWEYPMPPPYRRRRETFDALLRSRRGAEFTAEHVNCYFSKTVAECNQLYDNDFNPLA